MPTKPLYPDNSEQGTDVRSADIVAEADSASKIDKDIAESIKDYGTDKPRRKYIRATITHD